MRKMTADLSEIVSRGVTWWTGELKSLLPVGWVSGAGPRKADLVAIINGGRIVATIPTFGDSKAGAQEADILDEISRRAEQGPVRVKLRLPKLDCLVRSITVPKAAVKDIERIAWLDLERGTPLREADVHAALVIGPQVRAGSTVMAEQIVVKRSRISAIRTRLEAAGADVVGADCFRDDPGLPMAINFLAEQDAAPVTARTKLLPSTGILATGAGALALAVLAITTHRHEQALAGLREQTAAVRTRVTDAIAKGTSGGRPFVDALAQLKAQTPPVVALIEDLSRRMPDSAYVTELRVADGSVEIIGFGRPVRSLPPELERSPYFSSASITAPIVTDDERQKERFSLRLLLDKAALPVAGDQP